LFFERREEAKWKPALEQINVNGKNRAGCRWPGNTTEEMVFPRT
jgi:hypothetical protein